MRLYNTKTQVYNTTALPILASHHDNPAHFVATPSIVVWSWSWLWWSGYQIRLWASGVNFCSCENCSWGNCSWPRLAGQTVCKTTAEYILVKRWVQSVQRGRVWSETLWSGAPAVCSTSYGCLKEMLGRVLLHHLGYNWQMSWMHHSWLSSKQNFWWVVFNINLSIAFAWTSGYCACVFCRSKSAILLLALCRMSSHCWYDGWPLQTFVWLLSNLCHIL